MKKILSALLACGLLCSMCACSGGGNSSAESSTKSTVSSGTSSATEASTQGIDTSEHVVINYMTTGDIPANNTDKALEKLNEILTEKCNAELNIHWIEWTDYMTNYNLTLASQDGSVDLVGTATDWLDGWPNVKKGAFLELTEDMLKTYAPKTWEGVPVEDWDLCKYDDKIYLMPEDQFAQWTNHGFIYRNDWAKEAGINNGVHSWEDMGKYLQYIKENKPDVIPWDVTGAVTNALGAADGWIFSHTPHLYVEGLGVDLFFGNSKDDPYTLSNYFLEGDELVNYAKTMKQWGDAGYWREDVLNYTGDCEQEFFDGTTAANQHHTNTWYTKDRPMMDKKQPGSDVGFFFFGEETDNLTSLNITHGAMAISAASKNPERALMVYDLLRNDKECYDLVNYGIEGEQYTLNDEGQLVRPDDYDETVNGVTMNFWWGRNDELEYKNSFYALEPYDELIARYDEIANGYQYGKVVFNMDPISEYINNLSNVYNTYMPRIAFGKMDDPEAYVAEFRQALKDAGYEACMEEVQNQIQATYEK